MQKYKIWIILALLVLCILTLILWLSPIENTQASIQTDRSPCIPIVQFNHQTVMGLVFGWALSPTAACPRPATARVLCH